MRVLVQGRQHKDINSKILCDENPSVVVAKGFFFFRAALVMRILYPQHKG